MKIINMPTFAEYTSSQSGCGLRYTNNFKGWSGRYKQSTEALYFSHLELLDLCAKEYLLCCNDFDIDTATDEINHIINRNLKKHTNHV